MKLREGRQANGLTCHAPIDWRKSDEAPFRRLSLTVNPLTGYARHHRPSVTVSVNTFDVIDKDGAIMLWQKFKQREIGSVRHESDLIEEVLAMRNS
ncbi:hypothetical protein HED63_22325 [Ochrobactrum cytisi]|nr:hypothetical protein [Brucella cytisi]